MDHMSPEIPSVCFVMCHLQSRSWWLEGWSIKCFLFMNRESSISWWHLGYRLCVKGSHWVSSNVICLNIEDLFWGLYNCVFTLCFHLDDICDYFGVKIGMYFAWLGFYTNSMLYPAVIGFLLWILAEADQVHETFFTTKLLMLLSHAVFMWEIQFYRDFDLY